MSISPSGRRLLFCSWNKNSPTSNSTQILADLGIGFDFLTTTPVFFVLGIRTVRRAIPPRFWRIWKSIFISRRLLLYFFVLLGIRTVRLVIPPRFWRIWESVLIPKVVFESTSLHGGVFFVPCVFSLIARRISNLSVPFLKSDFLFLFLRSSTINTFWGGGVRGGGKGTRFSRTFMSL